MQFLHPVFTIAFVLLIAFSFLETYNEEYKNYRGVWFVIAFLIILSGFRDWVGADYPAYVGIYNYTGEYIPYSEIFDKALFGENINLQVEWIWALLGKVFYQFRFPFFYFTFFISIISLVPKYVTFESSVVYPALSMLLYMFPSYFTGDSGQMRQAVGMGIILTSFYFIKKRNLMMFLIMIYLAMGFHKSSVIFIPAYWLVKINLNPTRILILVGICMLLSPFQLYNYLTILETIAPQDIYAGFSDYSMIEGASTGVNFSDLICMMYLFFLVAFNKEACRTIPYYEYMRNIGVFGICIYFIFRGSPIFSTRLTMIYLIFMVMAVPNIIAAIQDMNMRRYMHAVVICFVVFFYFVYARMQAPRAGFNTERYQNFLFKR